MEEKRVTLKLALSTAGRLQKATLILGNGDEEVILSRKEKLLDPVKARVFRDRKKGIVFVNLPFHSIRRAASWKLDTEEEVSGLSIQMVNQKGAKIPLPHGIFRNPQYL